jgi:hypothetical protein
MSQGRWGSDPLDGRWELFLQAQQIQRQIKKKLISGEVKITPEFRQNEMIAMIGDGLEDVSFSRTKKQLTWGIPVPNDPDHVMYVWCDALTNYISGIIPPEKGGEGGLSKEDIDEVFRIGTVNSMSSERISLDFTVWPGLVCCYLDESIYQKISLSMDLWMIKMVQKWVNPSAMSSIHTRW